MTKKKRKVNKKKVFISTYICFLAFIFTICYLAPMEHHQVEFKENPCIKPHKRYHYLTCHAIDVEVDFKRITIPPEFDTDLASIPRWFWTFLSPAYSGFIAPSILHDYLYSCPGYHSRLQVDEIFYDSLVEHGVSRYTAYKMYLAVRIFGEQYYKEGNFCIYKDNDMVEPHDNEIEDIDYE